MREVRSIFKFKLSFINKIFYNKSSIKKRFLFTSEKQFIYGFKPDNLRNKIINFIIEDWNKKKYKDLSINKKI